MADLRGGLERRSWTITVCTGCWEQILVLGHADKCPEAREIAVKVNPSFVAEALADACQAVDSHYSASLDFQPIYVHLARKALAAYREAHPRPADQLRKEET